MSTKSIKSSINATNKSASININHKSGNLTTDLNTTISKGSKPLHNIGVGYNTGNFNAGVNASCVGSSCTYGGSISFKW